MELDEATDPFTLFSAWFAAADKAEKAAEAMSLATVTPEGEPDVRIVLLKEFGRDGFVFYTNTLSRKGKELAANPHAALCLFWKSLGRQVRIRGKVGPVTDAEADAYFASRPRDSRIGAWASQQSQPLESRAVLMARVAEVEARHPGDTVPRPPHWSGYRLVPERIEFWQEGAFRLHDRVEFTGAPGGWTRTRLNP
jgi:pyridoxamine 5'-phosphate oxidase